MARHKTFAIAPSFHNREVFKRKGRRVRYIDPATAKVGPWVADPEAPITGAEAIREALGVPDPDKVLKDIYQRKIVSELRALAGDLGIKVPSKARKADIIAALTNA